MVGRSTVSCLINQGEYSCLCSSHHQANPRHWSNSWKSGKVKSTSAELTHEVSQQGHRNKEKSSYGRAGSQRSPKNEDTSSLFAQGRQLEKASSDRVYKDWSSTTKQEHATYHLTWPSRSALGISARMLLLNTHGSRTVSKRSKRQSCAARIVAMGNKCGQCFVSVRCRMSTSHGIRAHSSEGTSALPDRMGSTGVGAHLSPKLLNETLLPMHHISGRARSISSWPWLTN